MGNENKMEKRITLSELAAVNYLDPTCARFFVENKEQPDVYNNGWKAVVWAFNQYIKDPGGLANTPPISMVGKLIAVAIGILKIAIFAVPAGLIGSGFLQAVNAEREKENLKNISDTIMS